MLEHEKRVPKDMGEENYTLPSKASKSRRPEWVRELSVPNKTVECPGLDQGAKNNKPKNERKNYSGTHFLYL